MGLSDMFCTTMHTLLLPIFNLVFVWRMCRPGGRGLAPLYWVLTAFRGVTIMWVLSPNNDLVFPSRISIWNGPSFTLSLIRTGSLISQSTESSNGIAPPSCAYSASWKSWLSPKELTACLSHSPL